MRTLSLALLLLLSACGRPLLFAEVEIPKATVVVPQQAFGSVGGTPGSATCTPAAGYPVAVGDTCLSEPITFDLGADFKDLTSKAESIELRLTSLGIRLVAASGGPTDFSTVKWMRLVVEGAGAGLPDAEVARYLKPAGATVVGEILVQGNADVNLGPYLEAGAVVLRAEIDFAQVIPGFTADVSSEFYAKILVDWGKQAGLF